MIPDPDDPFTPPKTPVLVECLHCGDKYLSSEMFYGRRFNVPYPLWWCKNPHCNGAGYDFDIRQVKP